MGDSRVAIILCLAKWHTRGGVAVSVYSRAFHHAFYLIDAFGVCDCKTIMRCVCVLVCLLVSIFLVRFNT